MYESFFKQPVAKIFYSLRTHIRFLTISVNKEPKIYKELISSLHKFKIYFLLSDSVLISIDINCPFRWHVQFTHHSTYIQTTPITRKPFSPTEHYMFCSFLLIQTVREHGRTIISKSAQLLSEATRLRCLKIRKSTFR